jgi:predicted N-acetyltransferase YhbS
MPRSDTLIVRPMADGDIRSVAELSAAAFGRDISDEANARRWCERVAHPLGTDPDGAFVAELDGQVVGVAEAVVRERLWVLSLFAVRPGLQSAGAGRALLEPAVAYGHDADAGLIVSSNDPRALRLYAGFGFALHPTLRADGQVDERALPPNHGGVREDGAGDDLESLASLTRSVRGAPYTSELGYALERGGRLLRLEDRGYAVVDRDGSLWLLVSRDDEAARALLSAALAMADGSVRVRWITGAQQWAIETLVQARLELAAYGALCVRGAPGPLRPFLPSAPFS